eukprot:9486091-Pyramimonas_sp.AAC.1
MDIGASWAVWSVGNLKRREPENPSKPNGEINYLCLLGLRGRHFGSLLGCLGGLLGSQELILE